MPEPKALLLLTSGNQSAGITVIDRGATLYHPKTKREWVKLAPPTSHKRPGWRRFLGRRDLYHATEAAFTYHPKHATEAETHDAPDKVFAGVTYTPLRTENEVEMNGARYKINDAFFATVTDISRHRQAIEAKNLDWRLILLGAGAGTVLGLIIGFIGAVTALQNGQPPTGTIHQ